MSIGQYVEVHADEWNTWQTEVVRLVRAELSELAPSIHGDDFDWEAWRFYFDEGYLPADAVKQALSVNSNRRDVGEPNAMSMEVD